MSRSRAVARAALVLGLLALTSGCLPSQGAVARSAVLIAPAALVVAWVLVKLLHLGWRRLDASLAFESKPWALTLVLLLGGAGLALATHPAREVPDMGTQGGPRELMDLAPLALVVVGSSLVTAVLVTWRALLAFLPRVAFRWCPLATIGALAPVPFLLVLPESDLARGIGIQFWAVTGLYGGALALVLLILLVELGLRVASGARPRLGLPERKVDLSHPLTLANSFRFPLQSEASRRDILVGGMWLFVPVLGWLMNMGHRIKVVHRMHRGEEPWPAFDDPLDLLKHGVYTFLGMVWYGWPGVGLAALGAWRGSYPLVGAGAALWLLAVFAIPGYMTHYCKELDPREIFDPFRALRRVREGGLAYWKAWSIVIPAMLLSFVGLLGFGFAFNFTSVWFWQVAAFSFATVFTQRFELSSPATTSRSST